MLIVWFLLLWIGLELGAPGWYPWALAILAIWKIFVD